MISKDTCRQIGILVKPHGTRGSLLLRLKDIQAQDFVKMESVFVEIDGLLVPFFLKEFKPASADSAIVTFDDVDTENKTGLLIQRMVFVSPDQIRRKRKKVNELPELKGYGVYDNEKGYMGTAGDIEDISNNPLLQVIHEGRNYLVPLHRDIILEIDNSKRVIRISAPDGLFDL